MRYVAFSAYGDIWQVRSDSVNPFSSHGIAVGTKAEMLIIEWALNEVSEKRDLYSRPRIWHGDVPFYEAQYKRYSGPTEGVAQ